MTNPGSGLLSDLGKPPPPPEDIPYYEALGRFIVAYAECEIAIHQLARRLTGIKDNRARVLFAGMRIGDVATRTRALLSLSRRALKTKETVEACLKQFDIIGTQRDKMVHRATDYASGAFSVTNIMTSKSALVHERDLFTIVDLRNLRRDCIIISIRLTHTAFPFLGKKRHREFLNFARGPWRYRPAPPKNPKRQSQPQGIVKALNRPPASQR
jgi:hypothetical protein